jgi:hypothetical protein
VMKLIGQNEQGLAGVEGQRKMIDMHVTFSCEVEGQHEAVMGSVLQRLLLQLVFCRPQKQQDISRSGKLAFSDSGKIILWFLNLVQSFIHSDSMPV